MDKADCSRTPKIEAKERVNNLGLPCGAPYGLDPLDHGRSDRNWNNNNLPPTCKSWNVKNAIKQIMTYLASIKTTITTPITTITLLILEIVFGIS